MLLALACLTLLLAALSAVMFCRNRFLYRRLPPAASLALADDNDFTPAVSVLIPARNEEANIAHALRAVLATRGVPFEVLVGDDHSTDRTADIVRWFAQQDRRVRLVSIPALPAGWNGKQHACHYLAQSAQGTLLCFVDADVRLATDALPRMAEAMTSGDAALISGVPRQETRTWMERLLIPLIHFVLLGYLPMDRMRGSTDPAYSAGCGQLFIARREAYRRAGGHAAVAASMHDGLKLPAAFRRSGFKTDLFDATDIASVRMYSNAAQVWDGLAKNASEGMAAPTRLPIFTGLLFGGHVLPFILLGFALWRQSVAAGLVSAAACMVSYLPRFLAVARFRQSFASALAHPAGIAMLLAIQWYALVRHLLGGRATWKGRAYVTNIAGSGDQPLQAHAIAGSDQLTRTG